MVLNLKQETFCLEYIASNFNATQAAVKAGYSSHTARFIGSENLTKPNIKKRIDELLEKRVQDLEYKSKVLIQELENIAFMDITKVISWKMRGNRLIVKTVNLEKLTPDQRKWIKSVNQTKKGFRITFHSKANALKLLGQHLGLFSEKRSIKSEPYSGPLMIVRG